MPDSQVLVAQLDVRIRHIVGPLTIDVEFVLNQGWTVLFGPSGSGKTTILRAIAGLLRTDFAIISSNQFSLETRKRGAVLADSSRSIFVPPHRREIPFVSQSPALFPHLSVAENIRFGYPRVSSGNEADYRNELSDELLRLFRIEHLLRTRPSELSGGEKQRVSLVRALMARPRRLLLLDEPLTGVDTPLRDLIIADLLAWREKRKLPVLSVTHDVGEAFLLGAEVLRLEKGKIVDQGPVERVLATERIRLLAQLQPAGLA